MGGVTPRCDGVRGFLSLLSLLHILSAIMSSSNTTRRGTFMQKFELGRKEHTPKYTKEDCRTYAEIVQFWDKTRDYERVVFIQPTYNPSLINKTKSDSKYFIDSLEANSNNNSVRCAIKFDRRLRRTVLEKLIFGLKRKYQNNSNGFYKKFKTIINKFNYKKYLKKNVGMPYTKSLLFKIAVIKVWEKLQDSYIFPTTTFQIPSGGFTYHSVVLPKTTRNIKLTSPDPIRKKKIVKKNILPKDHCHCKISFWDDIMIRTDYILHCDDDKDYGIDNPFKYNKNSNYKLLKEKINLVLKNRLNFKTKFLFNKTSLVHKPYNFYSKNYLNPKVYVTTSDPKYEVWCKNRYANVKFNPIEINHEMDDAHSQGVSAVQCKKSGNVVFLDERASSVAKPQKRLTPKMNQTSHADKAYAMQHASERELIIDNFLWNDEASGSVLKLYNFPAIILKNMENSPNSVPFKMSTFVNSDLEINIRVNSNKFQVGMLQCSWLYDPLSDANSNNRCNIFTLSQTNHCLINAGGSNIGTLYVPFISTYTSLPTVTNVANNSCLNLGRLQIFVLNKLTCPDSIAKHCSVTVSVKLVNPEFYGQKPQDTGKFIYPEMEVVGEVMAVAAAEKLLTTVKGDERDNPPYQGPSMKMVPMSNQSFCLGDQLVEPINTLRLDARGQHLPQVEGIDEMSIDYIKNIYGLVQTFSWQSNQHSGTLLKSWDASPQLLGSEYSGFKIKSDDFFCIPPVAVLSSLFAYWSGELKFRFDFVASQFHTGRVMVAYVPFLTHSVTFDQCKGYPNEVWDLQEHQQFVFNVPYISNYPCFKRRLGYTASTDLYIPPGRLYMFVLNELIPMDNVSNIIDINMYMAGGESFEVHIPAQPSIATCFYATDDTPSTLVKAIDGSWPWYFGNDNLFEDPTGTDHAIIRFSTFWNDISNFYNLKTWKYYKMTDTSAKSNKEVTVAFDQGTYSIADLYYVTVTIADGYGPMHLAACASKEQAENYWRNGPESTGRLQCLTIGTLTTSPYCIGNPIFDEFPVAPKSEEQSFVVVDSNIQHEMEERVVGNTAEQETTHCRVYGVDRELGHSIFGEKFKSLKILCRRYQPYGLAYPKSTTTYGDVLFSMPAIPHGLDMYLADTKLLPTLKKVREGTIPIILSGYRFFSGGLRFNLICDGTSRNVWIQHRPDYEGPAKITYPQGSRTAESLVNSGYAIYLQSTSVNNVISFEVPYYKNRPLIYLQKPASNRSQLEGAQHLGQIYVGAEGGKAEQNFSCGIMYSFADDAKAHVFQGFPAMLSLDNIQNAKSIGGLRTSKVNFEMFSLNANHKVELPEAATKMMDSLTKTAANIDDKLGIVSESISCIDTIKKNMKAVMIDVLGHIGHVLINPTCKHISWSVVHMLLKFGVVSELDIHKLVSPINRMAEFISSKTDDPSEPTLIQGVGCSEFVNPPINHEGPVCDFLKSQYKIFESILPVVSKFVISLVVCIASVLSLKVPDKDNISVFSYISALTHRVAGCAKDLRSLGDFFSGIIECIYKILEYIGLYNAPTKVFENMLHEELPLINDWFVEAKYLCDATREEHIFARDGALADRMEECYAMGVTISSHFISFYDSSNVEKQRLLGPQFTIFKDAFAELSIKRNDMLSRGYSSISRREPFCIYLSGPPGCGKSQMAQSLIPRLLTDQGISYIGEPIYTLMCGADYWNGCKSQPCVLIDDWLSVDSGTLKENDLKAYTTLKSCAILNPPQAALPDKQMRYAPEMMVVLSNKSFPKPVGVDYGMIWRRRDVLVECRMRDTLVGFKNMTDNKEHLFKKIEALGYNTRSPFFEHLEFQIANEPSQENTRWTGCKEENRWLTYQELLRILNKEFTLQRNWQMLAFNERRQLYEENLIHSTRNFIPSLKDKQEEFRRACRFLSTYIAKESVKNVNIFKLASDYARFGVIPERDREKIVLACRDSQLEKMRNEMKSKPPQSLSAGRFVNFECPTFPCPIGQCPKINFDMKTSVSMALKDEKLLPLVTPAQTSILSTSTLLLRIVDYFRKHKLVNGVTTSEISSMVDVSSGSTTSKDSYKREMFVPTMTKDVDSVLFNLAYENINKIIEDLMPIRVVLIKPKLFELRFTLKDKVIYYMKIKYEEEKLQEAGLEVTKFTYYVQSLTCNCGERVGTCKMSICHSIFNMSTKPNLPGTICNCMWFDSTCLYDKDRKIFLKDKIEINLGVCLDPLCYQKTSVWAKRVQSWKKANPTLVKMRQCPENFCHYTDKIVLFIDGIKDYFRREFPCVYNFFDNYVSPTFSKIFNVIKSLLPYVVGIGAIGALLHYLGYSETLLSHAVTVKDKITGFYKKKDEVDVEFLDYNDCYVREWLDNHDLTDQSIPPDHELIHSGDNAKPKKIVKGKKPAKPLLRKVARLESGLFVNDAYIALRKRIKNNTFIMESEDGDKFRILLLHQQNFIFLKHYWEELSHKFGKIKWKLVNCSSEREFNVSPELWSFDFDDATQIGFVKITEIPPQRSLLKALVFSENDHKQGVGQCLVVSPDVGGCEQMLVNPMLVSDINIVDKGNMKSQHLDLTYRYNWSAPGNCCSVLIDPARNPSIIGIHVAGNGINGYAEPISKDQFLAWLPDSVEREEDFDEELIQPYEDDDRLNGEFIPIGRIHHQLAHNESGESQIKPSLVHGEIFRVSTDIAPLSNHDARMQPGYSPMVAGVSNMFRPPLAFSPRDVAEAKDYFKNEILTICKPVCSVVRKRTIEEVIDGIPHLQYFDGLVMNTSEGFPFSSYRPNSASNKSWLFQRTGNPIQTIGINKDLFATLEADRNKRRNNIAVNTVFIDCLKDARLPLNKVLIEGKTRIFSISPVQYTMAFKEQFMDFMAAFKTHRFDLEHAIGINPDGPQWGHMVQHMNNYFKGYGTQFEHTKEGFYFSGDYKNFGPTLSHQIVQAINDIILAWCSYYYQDNNVNDENIRRCLLFERTYSYHLCFDLIYQPLCGAPSGGPDTVELNSFVNKFYIYLALKHLINQTFLNTIDAGKYFRFQPDMFRNLIHMISYGDDVIFKIHYKLLHIFNNKTLSKFFSHYNIGYTDAAKTGIIDLNKTSLSDITFLKRGFIPHPKWVNEFLAPLDEDVSVKDVCNWIHKSDFNTPKEATVLSIEGCCANAYSLGPDKHREIRSQLQAALIRLGCDSYLRTWDNWDEIHFAPYYSFTRVKF